MQTLPGAFDQDFTLDPPWALQPPASFSVFHVLATFTPEIIWHIFPYGHFEIHNQVKMSVKSVTLATFGVHLLS